MDFEGLKPEERGEFRARLVDSCPPCWTRADMPANQSMNRPVIQEDDDIERPVGGGQNQQQMSSEEVYVQRNRMPPIKVCLWYNPLMYMSPSATRSEWEQQLGGFPAFFIYTMSRSIYSSATNPLLKPEYFMPEVCQKSSYYASL